MHKAVIFALSGTLILAPLAAQAQVYQWKDASGKTVVSDTPPPGNSRSMRSLSNGGTIEKAAQLQSAGTPAPTSPPAETSPKTVADRELEYRKRQQENKEKAEKLAKETENETRKQKACEQVRRQLAVAQSGRPIVTIGDNGEQQVMNDSARSEEIERMNQQIGENCR